MKLNNIHIAECRPIKLHRIKHTVNYLIVFIQLFMYLPLCRLLHCVEIALVISNTTGIPDVWFREH